MPIYTYQCQDEKCAHIEDDVLIISVSREELERPHCPKCEGDMKQVVSGSYLIHFKGDGFYQTDVNNKKYQ